MRQREMEALLKRATKEWFLAGCPGKQSQFVAARLVAAMVPPSGRGRVTSERFDQRLKANRDRRSEPKP
jgi:hypothetical protein